MVQLAPKPYPNYINPVCIVALLLLLRLLLPGADDDEDGDDDLLEILQHLPVSCEQPRHCPISAFSTYKLAPSQVWLLRGKPDQLKI